MMKLEPYQQAGVDMIIGFGRRALLADEMGLGKTAQALAVLKQSGAISRAEPFVVVCEASTKENWSREIQAWLGLRSTILTGRKPKGTIGTRHPVYIVNYDILGGWIEALHEAGCRHLIIDECQNLTNPQAKRTANVRDIARPMDSVQALSGTPLSNLPAEIWPILNILRPDIWPSFYPFAAKHCRPRLQPWGWEYKGAEDMAGLHRQLRATVLVRRLKDDVLDLPPKHRVVVPVPLMNYDRYAEAADDFFKWLKQHQRGGQLAKAEKAKALYRVGELVRLTSKEKAKACVQWLDDWMEANPTEKMVFFGHHQKFLNVIRRRAAWGPQSVFINGSVATAKRQGLVDQFNHDAGTRLLIGNIRAAGVGLNMVQARSTAFGEIWWNPSAHTQAEDRTHRYGQKRPCYAYYLVADRTVELDIIAKLAARQEIQGRALDGDRDKRRHNGYEDIITQRDNSDKPTKRRAFRGFQERPVRGRPAGCRPNGGGA